VKKILLTAIVFILLSGVVGAQDGVLVGYNQSWTLHDLAASEKIPVKQLARDLGLDYREVQDRSLSELDISRQDAEAALTMYREAESDMVGSIVLVGMLIVFASLAVVSFLISLFKYLHIFGRKDSGKKRHTVKTDIGNISSSGELSEKVVAAVVAAVFLHEGDVEMENRLLLTWKRTSSRVWKSGDEMPNAIHFASRRGR